MLESVSGLSYAIVLCEDMDLMKAFYRELLPFPVVSESATSMAMDAGGVLLVAWTTAQFLHVVRIPGVEAGASFAQTGMFGEARPTLRHDPRGLHVNVTGAPVYLLKEE